MPTYFLKFHQGSNGLHQDAAILILVFNGYCAYNLQNLPLSLLFLWFLMMASSKDFLCWMIMECSRKVVAVFEERMAM